MVSVTEPTDTAQGSRELDQLGDVAARLTATFSPPLRPAEVQRALLDTMARFDGAPVTAFLPILVERAAADRLRAAIERHNDR